MHCDKAQPVDFALPANPLLGLTVESVYGRTVPRPLVNAQAYAGAAIVTLRVPGLAIRLEIVESSSSVGCTPAKTPLLFNRGGVADLHIDGMQVTDFENGPRSVSLPGPGSLEIDKTTRTAGEITFTAFKLTPAAIFPAITLADTKAGFSGTPAEPDAVGPAVQGGGGLPAANHPGSPPCCRAQPTLDGGGPLSIAISARRLAVLATALVGVAPPTAHAAGPPAASTGGVTDRTTTTVTLNGRVNPNGATTRYYFQFGTTRNYTATTGVVVAGDGTQARRVSAAVVGLAPATTYHYRLVAENRFDIRRGEDRTFRTRAEPLGISLTASPNPVLFNDPTVVSGTLTGTGNAGRQVVLQTDPWPYDAFVNTGNGVVTDANGGFQFPILALGLNTQARVVVADKPEVSSPVVLLQALPRVTTKLRTKRYPRSKRVRFSGVVTPAITGEQMQVQRLVDGSWEVVRTMRAKARRSTDTSSRYEKSMLIRATGRYRVVANISSGAYTSSPGREVRIKVKKRRSGR